MQTASVTWKSSKPHPTTSPQKRPKCKFAAGFWSKTADPKLACTLEIRGEVLKILTSRSQPVPIK